MRSHLTAAGHDQARQSFLIDDPDHGARMCVKEFDFACFLMLDGSPVSCRAGLPGKTAKGPQRLAGLC